MKIAIYGYGNLGRGVESAVKYNQDMEIIGVFTRRDPSTVRTLTGIPVYSADEILRYKSEIDVLILCGGSATDLPEMTPELAEHFNVVDSFDTHAKIPEHFERVNAAAQKGGNIALISSGWDPGLFSLARVYASSVLPSGKDYTFWGRGISQGHSDAIRRVLGVVDARQYTVPVDEAVALVKAGGTPELSTAQKHKRECYIVAEEGADLDLIERTVKEMPNYFKDYDTSVTFITMEELKRDHSGMPHGGSVIRNGISGLNGEHNHTFEFSLKLDSNPEFTAGVLAAYARAVARISARGEVGARTVLDIAPIDISPLTPDEARRTLL